MEGGSCSSTARTNQKQLVYKVATSEDIGLAPGGIVERSHKENLRDFVDRVCEEVQTITAGSLDCFLRGCISQGGLDTLVVNAGHPRDDLARWLGARPDQTHYLVEEFVSATSSPNVQSWVSHLGEAEPIALVTDQRLEGGIAHYGNSYPHHPLNEEQSPRLLRLCQVLNHWLARNGYSGSVGFAL